MVISSSIHRPASGRDYHFFSLIRRQEKKNQLISGISPKEHLRKIRVYSKGRLNWLGRQIGMYNIGEENEGLNKEIFEGERVIVFFICFLMGDKIYTWEGEGFLLP